MNPDMQKLNESVVEELSKGSSGMARRYTLVVKAARRMFIIIIANL